MRKKIVNLFWKSKLFFSVVAALVILAFVGAAVGFYLLAVSYPIISIPVVFLMLVGAIYLCIFDV